MSIHKKYHRWQSLISLGLFMSLLIIFLGHSQKVVSQQDLMPVPSLSQIQTPIITQPLPEGATGRQERQTVQAQQQMVVAANPLASQAGLAVLRRGGNAIDAAIAVQGVLNLVEPQSSGIGGGGFLVYYNAAQKKVVTYDGRETAPAAARGDRFLDAAGKPLAFYDAVIGGKSVGTPGLLKMLELAHREQGKLPWRELWQPAIALASQGFPISPRLYSLLEKDRFLKQNPAAQSYFYQQNGEPKPVGTILQNPNLAQVLQIVADQGIASFYQGSLAAELVQAVKAAGGDLTLEDLANYQAKPRPPVCGAYRNYQVCGMGAPSSGGLTILQMLGILNNFHLKELKPNSEAAVHLFSEVGRLAFSDRSIYMADSDFIPVPTAALIEPLYLQERSQLIRPYSSLGIAMPGQLPNLQSSELEAVSYVACFPDSGCTEIPPSLQNWGIGLAGEFPSTTHISIVDRFGNAVSMTTSIEDTFGSRLMVRGFLLNNQLTDFSFAPEVDGKPVANRVQPGKRPRSSMSPTLVFNLDSQANPQADPQATPQLKMVIGSPGGSNIINYVAKVLVATLDWDLDIQEAIALPNFGSRNGATELEAETRVAALKPSLEAIGHRVQVMDLNSGLHGITVNPDGLRGGVDPRREGLAIGD